MKSDMAAPLVRYSIFVELVSSAFQCNREACYVLYMYTTRVVFFAIVSNAEARPKNTV